eukprot:jgi/Undpi1/2361/HiC_scaffold_13.g05744.m1
MVLLSEAPVGAEDTDAPDDDVDDDEDEPVQEFWRCLQAMAIGETVRKLRAWRTAYYALKGSRKEGNRKGMTGTLNEKQEQGISSIVPGFLMPTATRRLKLLKDLGACRGENCYKESDPVEAAAKTHGSLRSQNGGRAS